MISSIHDKIVKQPIVDEALREGKPVVALESTVISHGLPYPDNIAITLDMMEAITNSGAVPAVIALIDGYIHIGLQQKQIEQLAHASHVLKVNRADISYCLMKKQLGATTVSATMFCAALVGISVFTTGGIGGVHRGAECSFDISTDLGEFQKSPVLVVCSGVKSILDVPKTLEYFETLGVPVLGYQTESFPLFFSRESPYEVLQHLDSPEEVIALLDIHKALGLKGLVLANPIPKEHAIPYQEVEEWVSVALKESENKRIKGKDVTPYLLKRVSELSKGRSLEANKALLKHNATISGQIALNWTLSSAK